MITSLKKLPELGSYFGILLKILCSTTFIQSSIARPLLVQDVRQRASPIPMPLLNAKKAQAG